MVVQGVHTCVTSCWTRSFSVASRPLAAVSALARHNNNNTVGGGPLMWFEPFTRWQQAHKNKPQRATYVSRRRSASRRAFVAAVCALVTRAPRLAMEVATLVAASMRTTPRWFSAFRVSSLLRTRASVRRAWRSDCALFTCVRDCQAQAPKHMFVWAQMDAACTTGTSIGLAA